ncbi:MAG: ATP-dependent helicase HrpB [Myxococcota bacterium]
MPVDRVLPELTAALLSHRAAVLTAPPGSGKTTRAPPALLDAGVAGSGKVALLQPRRVAARMSARRIAWERGVRPGEEVGWRVRFEDRTSAKTRIEVLTEGLLTRRLQADPFLEDVGVVILDEFHERSLHADLALALLAEAQAARDDLRVLVMSATLDPAPIVDFFEGDCPVITAGGRPYPVTVVHLKRPVEGHIEPAVVRTVEQALDAQPGGHVLVFLPGVAEIERVRQQLGDRPDVDVLPLHGRLKSAEQDRALAPSKRRKVVLATNIAETSVTLQGVSAVVDSGLQRAPRFDPSLGLTRLETARISRASAEQRAGRAGRTGPGTCYRLWTDNEHRLLDESDRPEVQRADLASAALEVFAWGVDPRAFRWFEPPPRANLQRAIGLLEMLGAVAGGAITASGEELAALPLHPRLGRLILEGHRRGCLHTAATVAALVSERDPWGRSAKAAGLLEKVAWVDQRRTGADPLAIRTIRQVREQLIRVADRWGPAPRGNEDDESAVLRAFLAGFPDRVAQQRAPEGRRFRLASGRGAQLDRGLLSAPLLVAAEMTAGRRGEEPIIRSAAALSRAWLQTQIETVLRFDGEREAVISMTQERYGALILSEKPSTSPPDPGAVSALLAEAAAAAPERALSMTPAVEAWLARLRWLASVRPEMAFPTFEDLGPLLAEWSLGRRSFAELRRMDLRNALEGRLTWPQRQALQTDAPERLQVPSGSQARIRYAGAGQPPVLAARIQQLFGMAATPMLAGGRASVLVHLLAPNNRPVQITDDLESFWERTYAEVRSDLRGRYPKHAWPEHPTAEDAEDRPKRNRRRT